MITKNGFTTGAEIGCANGATTYHLLRFCPQLRLIAVDKWTKVEVGTDVDGCTVCEGYDGRAGDNCTGWDPVKGFAKFNTITRPYSRYLTVLKGDSSTMAGKVEDDSLDFVFIDADHRYEAVIKDLAAWVPKLKSGGILCGHDIHLVGVRKAIDEKLLRYEDAGVDYVWFCKKEDYVV